MIIGVRVHYKHRHRRQKKWCTCVRIYSLYTRTLYIRSCIQYLRTRNERFSVSTFSHRYHSRCCASSLCTYMCTYMHIHYSSTCGNTCVRIFLLQRTVYASLCHFTYVLASVRTIVYVLPTTITVHWVIKHLPVSVYFWHDFVILKFLRFFEWNLRINEEINIFFKYFFLHITYHFQFHWSISKHEEKNSKWWIDCIWN